jgi:hypothetical protein
MTYAGHENAQKYKVALKNFVTFYFIFLQKTEFFLYIYIYESRVEQFALRSIHLLILF